MKKGRRLEKGRGLEKDRRRDQGLKKVEGSGLKIVAAGKREKA